MNDKVIDSRNDVDDQFLVDTLIRSLQWRNDAKMREFGQKLVDQWGAFQGTEEDGVLRPFDELEDTDFVIESLELSPKRAEELQDGDSLTRREAVRLADAVEGSFEADGENDAWDVAKIESADGRQAYVAQVLKEGALFEGPECTFVGVFRSLEQAKEALKELGYIDGEDFRRRYPLRNA